MKRRTIRTITAFYYGCPVLIVSTELSCAHVTRCHEHHRRLVRRSAKRDGGTVEELERAWQSPDSGGGPVTAKINNAQLTITRHGAADFQDRQVYLFVDEEP